MKIILEVKSFRNSFFKIDELSIHQGDRLHLRGESGSGKTQFFEALFLFRKGEFEKMQLRGNSISDNNINQLRKSICYVPQNPKFPFQPLWEIFEELESIKRIPSREDIQKSWVELFEKPLDLEKNYTDLSGGERQILHLLFALLSEVDILILDEIFNAMDINLRKKVEDFVLRRQKEKAIIFTHHLDNLEYLRPNKVKTISAEQ